MSQRLEKYKSTVLAVLVYSIQAIQMSRQILSSTSRIEDAASKARKFLKRHDFMLPDLLCIARFNTSSD